MTPGSHLIPVVAAGFDGIEYAACAGTRLELWFIKAGDNANPAKAICNTCPVKQACLEYALANGERFGIYGGLTPRERGQIRRRREMRTVR